jgi:very-short-patch-repair endonuclease
MSKGIFKNYIERSRKIKESLKGRKLSSNHIDNIKKGLHTYYANNGENPMKGKRHSLSSKKLQSEHSAAKRQEVKEKMAISQKKRFVSLEEREKTSVATKIGMKKVNMSLIVRKAYKEHPEYKNKIRKARLDQYFPTKDTMIEKKIQEELKRRNIKFLKNKKLLNRFRVDIFIKPNIIIECDGCFYHACKKCNMTKFHQYSIKRDKEKTKELEKKGFRVYRFWGHEINKSVEKCINKIKEIKNGTSDRIIKILGKYEKKKKEK